MEESSGKPPYEEDIGYQLPEDARYATVVRADGLLRVERGLGDIEAESVAVVIASLQAAADGLTDATIEVTGCSDCWVTKGLQVEGYRPVTDADRRRWDARRADQRKSKSERDRRELERIRTEHPEWFS